MAQASLDVESVAQNVSRHVLNHFQTFVRQPESSVISFTRDILLLELSKTPVHGNQCAVPVANSDVALPPAREVAPEPDQMPVQLVERASGVVEQEGPPLPHVVGRSKSERGRPCSVLSPDPAGQAAPTRGKMPAHASKDMVVPHAVVPGLSDEAEKYRRDYRQFRLGAAKGAKGEPGQDNNVAAHGSWDRAFVNAERELFQKLFASTQDGQLVNSKSSAKDRAALARSRSSPQNVQTSHSLADAWHQHDTRLTHADDHLIRDIQKTAGTVDLSCWFAVWGLHSGSSIWARLHRWTFALCFCGTLVYQLWTTIAFFVDNDITFRRYSGATAAMVALCTLACNVSLHATTGKGGELQIIQEAMKAQDISVEFKDLWKSREVSSSLWAAVLWLIALATNISVVLAGCCASRGCSDVVCAAHVPDLVGRAIVRGMFTATMCYISTMCDAQSSLIDHYCTHELLDEHNEHDQHLQALRREWNKVQALLRRCGEAIGPCVMVATLVPVLSLVLVFIRLLETNAELHLLILEMLPAVVLIVYAARLMKNIGHITAAGARVPLYMNSLLLGDMHDEDAET
eukprot:TRINITY_DN4770_c0_g1_i3.p1 TRINITY_DN4770_c0_g1~~TRINITY_DN4770_c0_g1_i3.p1  ORF type:complete len:595 (+),score=82.37 TRINITY_DN4770_c0_g1_i3:68-1786(+)